MLSNKAPNPTDKHVGSRVRMRRMMLSMSQEKLGDALGLTFQQVQKYEKGTNRIGASRLQQIARALQVTESFFFEGAPGQQPDHGEGVPLAPDFTQEFLSDREGLQLARAFLDIENPKLRTALVRFAEAAAKPGAVVAKAA